MSSTEATTPEPFGRIKVRVSGLVFCGNEVALLRRDRPTSVPYTTIGGNALPGEGFRDALRRELDEELGLRPGQASGAPELIWMLDARLSRPGPTPSPRKIHLIHRLHVTPEVRAGLATRKYDELPDGGREIGHIEWIDHRRTADLPLFPPVGRALAQLVGPHAAGGDVELPPVTDADHTWI